MAEIPEGKDLNMTQLHNLVDAAATVITEDVNGTWRYKSETQSPKTPLWIKWLQESINGIRKQLSALAEVTRDEMKTQSEKKDNLTEYNKVKGDNFDQQKSLNKKQQQRCNDCQDTGNKMFRTDCKKFYNLLMLTNTKENSQTKQEIENFWKEIYGEKA